MSEYLGRQMRDKATGFTGVVVADVSYLDGRRSLCLEAMSTTGALLREWFDIRRFTQLRPVEEVIG